MLPDKISNSKLINEYGEINEDLTVTKFVSNRLGG